jgi:hypothetical protein
MTRSRKFELAVQGVVEEVAKLIGCGVRREWPEADTRVDVSFRAGRIDIAFRTSEPPRTALALEPFRWDGPFGEPPRELPVLAKGLVDFGQSARALLVDDTDDDDGEPDE